MRVIVDSSSDAPAASSKASKGHSGALANEDGKSEGEKEGAEAEEEEDDDEDEEKILGAWGGIVAMFIATVFIAILSEEIVDAVDGASRSLNIPGMEACLGLALYLQAEFFARVLQSWLSSWNFALSYVFILLPIYFHRSLLCRPHPQRFSSARFCFRSSATRPSTRPR